MTIIHRNADGSIKTYMEVDAGTVLEKGETLERIDTSFEEYSDRLVLSYNGVTGITAHADVSNTPLIVDVKCGKNIDLDVNGETKTVKVKNGAGQLSIPREKKQIVTIEPHDKKEYFCGGGAVLTIIIGEELSIEERISRLEAASK